jgi:hypothetical protein
VAVVAVLGKEMLAAPVQVQVVALADMLRLLYNHLPQLIHMQLVLEAQVVEEVQLVVVLAALVTLSSRSIMYEKICNS